MIEEEKELSKEELDKLEKEEILKFAVTMFSIITIITITLSVIGLNIDRDHDEIPGGGDCGGCDDDYYNESLVMGYKQILEVLYERYN